MKGLSPPPRGMLRMFAAILSGVYLALALVESVGRQSLQHFVVALIAVVVLAVFAYLWK